MSRSAISRWGIKVGQWYRPTRSPLGLVKVIDTLNDYVLVEEFVSGKRFRINAFRLAQIDYILLGG